MKNIILVTIVILIFTGNLIAEISVHGFQFSPFLYFEKQLYSTLKIKHDAFFAYPQNKMKIFTSDHIALGSKIQRSYFFTVANYKISLYDGKTTPACFDLNAGINYKYFSAYTGKIFSMQHGDNEMLENLYFGISSNWNKNRFYILSDLQYIDGEYKNCSNENESFTTFASNLQLSYAFKKLYPYGSFSISDHHYKIAIGISLLNPPKIKSAIQSVINRRIDHFVDKPNIYLYPEVQCDVEVYLRPNGKITKSIPEYNNGWKVSIKPTGLIDEKYNFLFYEALVDVEIPNSGWCIAMNEFNDFFKTLLQKYGLNDMEIKDFIEYWSKRLEGASHYCIYILVNDDLKDICPITINPEPDNMLRVWFIFVPVEDIKSMTNPKISEFNRDGFDVVEWGGILRN